uniref:Uncharacterized protein n=1 Tax=Anguilla anguilla TaxID=7936 RepID=A0A0E9XI34_ANGAN
MSQRACLYDHPELEAQNGG